MLLFIVNEEPEEFNDYNFNTSHVTVYRDIYIKFAEEE